MAKTAEPPTTTTVAVLPAKPMPKSPVKQTPGLVGKEAANVIMDSKDVAPKATPEDSLIDSYSPSSEEDRNKLCLILEAQSEASMLREESPVQLPGDAAQWNQLNSGGVASSRNSQDVTSPQANAMSYLNQKDHRNDSSELTPAAISNPDGPYPRDKKHFISKRLLLLRQGSDSDHFDSGSGSQLSHSSHSGGQATPLPGSRSSLPADLPYHPRHPDSLFAPVQPGEDLRSHTDVVLHGGHSDTWPASDLLSSTATMQPSTEHSATHKSHVTNPSLTLSLSQSGNQLTTGAEASTHTGLSPGSPTYYETHSKFCHSGAHALDLFVTPEESLCPSDSFWRPVAHSTVQDSPTQFRTWDSPGSGRIMLTPPTAATVEPLVSSYDYDADIDEVSGPSQPLLGDRHCDPPPYPTVHIPTASTESNAKCNAAPRESQRKFASHAKKTFASRTNAQPSAQNSSPAKGSSSHKPARGSRPGVFATVPDTSIRSVEIPRFGR